MPELIYPITISRDILIWNYHKSQVSAVLEYIYHFAHAATEKFMILLASRYLRGN